MKNLLKQAVAVMLQVAGVVFVTVAAFMQAPRLGWVVAGVGAVLLGVAVERDRSPIAVSSPVADDELA